MKRFPAAVALLFLFLLFSAPVFAQDKSFIGGGLSLTGQQGVGSRTAVGVFGEGQYSREFLSEYLRIHAHNLVTVENEPKIGAGDGTTVRYRFQPIASYQLFGDDGLVRLYGGGGIQLTRQTNKFYSKAGANPMITAGFGLTNAHTFTGTYLVEDPTDWNNNFVRGTRYGYHFFLPLENSRLAIRSSIEYQRFSFAQSFAKPFTCCSTYSQRIPAWSLGGRVGVVFH